MQAFVDEGLVKCTSNTFLPGPPHVDYPALPMEEIAHYIAVNRTNKQPNNSSENRRTKRPSSEIDIRVSYWAVATRFVSPYSLKPIASHHRQSSRISRGFRVSTYCSVSSRWVAPRVAINSPFSPFSQRSYKLTVSPLHAVLQTRCFLHFPRFYKLAVFSILTRFYQLAVFSIFPRFYKLAVS